MNRASLLKIGIFLFRESGGGEGVGGIEVRGYGERKGRGEGISQQV